MYRFALLAFASVAAQAVRIHKSGKAAHTVVSNIEIDVGSLRFEGVECNHAGAAGNVLLLHGFPASTAIYTDLMQQLCMKGFRSVAYNQRGYSPLASPPHEADYHYDKLREDVWNVANKMGMEKFHLVAHDHGALLGYYTAGTPEGTARILTYTALSIPHPNAFSIGLLGDESDIEQQCASSYFHDFITPNSASVADNFLHRFFFTGFVSTSALQTALWWYNGVFAAKVLALPPRISSSKLKSLGFRTQSLLRSRFGDEPSANNTWPSNGQTQNPIGDLTMPVLYAIGTKDATILGTKPFALKTKEFCKGGYTYFAVEGAGHNLPGDLATCPSCSGLYDAIIAHVSA